jgi:rhamnosyltransferase
MMNEVAATVILYYTDAETIFHNLSSYLPFAERVFVVDNSPDVNQEICRKLASYSNKIVYIPNETNVGMAAALNIAAARAMSEGYKWLLTMDQDSSFDSAQITGYFSSFRELFSNRLDVAMVGPQHARTPREENKAKVSEVLSLITSGSLLNLALWQQLGGFDEKLFIDEVDHEYGYRAVAAGKHVCLFNHIFLKITSSSIIISAAGLNADILECSSNETGSYTTR